MGGVRRLLVIDQLGSYRLSVHRMSLVVLAVPLLRACGSTHRSPSSVAGGCGSTSLHRGAVPTWTAHSNPPPYLPFAVGAHGMAAAFIFGYPLRRQSHEP